MSKWIVLILFLGILTSALWFVFRPTINNLVEAYNSKLQPPPTRPAPNPDKLFFLINEYREQNNLPAFEKNDELCSIAEKRSNNYLDYHKGFLAEYSSYPYKVSENVTTGLEPNDAFQGWKGSPAHNAAMLADWKYACVACDITCVTIFSSFVR